MYPVAAAMSVPDTQLCQYQTLYTAKSNQINRIPGTICTEIGDSQRDRRAPALIVLGNCPESGPIRYVSTAHRIAPYAMSVPHIA
eukprot:362176-Rhodomonas_salina.1